MYAQLNGLPSSSAPKSCEASREASIEMCARLFGGLPALLVRAFAVILAWCGCVGYVVNERCSYAED